MVMAANGGVRNRLWYAWLVTIILSEFQKAHGLEFEKDDDVIYKLDTRYNVTGFTYSCPSSIAIDPRVNANSSVLGQTRIDVEGRNCRNGEFSLNRVDLNQGYTLKYTDVEGLDLFQLDLDDGFYGGIEPGDNNILCGNIVFFTPSMKIVSTKSGMMTWNQGRATNATVVPIKKSTLFLIRRESRENSGKTFDEFNICGYTKKACFPASATVQLESGWRARMDQLEVGDRVLVGNGQFSDVHTFGHREGGRIGRFVVLEIRSGERLRISGEHLVPVSGKYIPADSIQVGDLVTLGDGQVEAVCGVSTTRERGFFAPHTLDGEIVVDGVVASTYTSHLPPKYAHKLLAPARLAYRLTGIDWLGGTLNSGAPMALQNAFRILRQHDCN